MSDDEEDTPAGLGISQDIGPWQVFMRWEQGSAQGGPRYLTIRPNPGVTPDQLAGGLSSTVVRQINFQRAQARWREFAAGDDNATTEFEKRVGSMIKDLSTILRTTLANGVDERYLAWLSLAYVTVVTTGEGPVTENLAELIQRGAETVRGHLKKARTQQLLTKVEGRAGGELTPKARKIIEDEVHEMKQRADG